jgi:hypothetical protein
VDKQGNRKMKAAALKRKDGMENNEKSMES